MKKRLLSALLALALVFVLLPTTALAGETTGKDYDISINGKGWKFEKDTPVYFYGYDPSNYFFSTTADHQWTTNSNLMLTKEGNTVTITIRPSKYHPYESPQFTLKKESTSTEKNDVPCIEMGNDNNLVITGKGTLNITRNESKSYGAALYSNVGDITINGGITVNVSFLNGNDYLNKNTTSNAIHVGNNHNLTVSGSGTNVTATNQGFDSSPATVCVEGGTITVSGGASLSATNTYADNFSGSSVTQHFKSYAISGTESKPCTLIVADEKSSVTAWAYDEKYGKPFGFVTYNITGATVKAGSNAYYATETAIDKIDGKEYVKISVPALEKDSYVSIAGESAVVGVETKIPTANGSGTYFYDQASKTLTLNNVTINKTSNKAAKAIQFDKNNGTYTVNLVGTNTISNVSYGISTNSAYSEATSMSVTITGSGSLDISANAYAIEVPKGDLTFDGTGEIKLTTGTIIKGKNVLSVSGDIAITNKSKYSVTGTVQDGTKDGGDTVTLGEASHLNGYLDVDNTMTYLKSITIAPKPSEAYYNNTAMKYGETRFVGSGTISCDENGVITLNGVTEGTLVFNSSSDSTLVLEGTNTLSSIVTTQKGLTISGSGSLAAGSIRVPNNTTTSNSPNLTIDGATVIAGTNTSTTRAIEVKGDLTVKNNATLTATSKSDSVPTVQVGGNASFTGSTVTITNNSATQGKSGEYSYAVSTGLYVGGTLDIKNAAKVTSTVIGGNAIYAKGDITISGNNTEVKAQNSAYKFSAISTNGTVNISDNSTVKAENGKKHQGDPTGETDPSTGKTYNPCPAINGKIANKNTQNKLHIAGFTTSSAGSQNPTEGTPLNFDIDPSSAEPYIHHYKVTITRGDEVTRTNSPVVIAGTTLLNDTYYTINGSTVAVGSENNYNAFYDSANKTLKLNNAKISHSFAYEYGDGTDGAIIFKEYKNYCIELSGTNTISSMNTYAINGDTNSLTIKNAAGTENAKLTLTSNWTAICSTEGLNIQSDVTMVNTKRADHLMYVNGTFSFDGYNAYASVNASGSPLVEYTVPTSGDKDAGYQYLRITKETLETGGGSTHQHTYDQSAWKSDATHHWQECTDPNCPDPTKGITNKASHSFSNGACTVCGYSGQTEEHHFGTEWISDAEYHWHKCIDEGCTAISDKAPHEWVGWKIDEPRQGMHNRFCNCGYNDYGHHYNLAYAAAGEAGHYQYCTLGNCTFKTSTVPHNYDGDTCTICNYTKSGEIVPPTPDNPGTIVIIRPAEEEKPAQQPNPSTGANDLVGLAVAAAVAAALGSAALLRKHD